MRKLSQVHYQSKGDSIRGSEIETGTSIDVWLCGAGEINQFIFVFCRTKRSWGESFWNKSREQKVYSKKATKGSASTQQQQRRQWGQKKTRKGWRSRGVAQKGFSHYWGPFEPGDFRGRSVSPTCDTFLLLRRIAFVTRALPPLRFNGNRSRANIFRFGSVQFSSVFWWGCDVRAGNLKKTRRVGQGI